MYRLVKVEGLRETLIQRGGMGQGVGRVQPWSDPWVGWGSGADTLSWQSSCLEQGCCSAEGGPGSVKGLW